MLLLTASNSTISREQEKLILILYKLVVNIESDIRINSIFKIVGKVICFPVHLTNICIKPYNNDNNNDWIHQNTSKQLR